MIYTPNYSKGPLMSMMTQETLSPQVPFSIVKNSQSNPSETEQVNSSGPGNRDQMASGSALMRKYLQTKGINTSIPSTSGRSITTTPRTWTLRPSQELVFSIRNGHISSPRMVSGTVTGTNSTSQRP